MTPTSEKVQPAVKVTRSSGKGKNGMPIFYVRPSLSCENRSRRFAGYDKMNKGIKKWFGPEVHYYLVEGRIIGSNNEMNALREYWQICEKEKIGKYFEVKPFNTQA